MQTARLARGRLRLLQEWQGWSVLGDRTSPLNILLQKQLCGFGWILARGLQEWIVEWKRHEGMDAAEEWVQINGRY